MYINIELLKYYITKGKVNPNEYDLKIHEINDKIHYGIRNNITLKDEDEWWKWCGGSTSLKEFNKYCRKEKLKRVLCSK